MAERTQNTTDFSSGSEYNVLHFIISNIVKGMVNTCIPVRVDAIERPADGRGAGYLSATPLIQMRSAAGDALVPVSIPKLRWFRYQHGKAAVIVDPKVGDVGLAVFAQQDVSSLNGENVPKPPQSFRCYDLSDGFYFGGFWGQKPETFVRLEDTGDITITAPQTVTVNTTACTVNASDSAVVNTTTAELHASGSTLVDSPESSFTGNVTVQGKITGMGGMAISGGSGAAATVTGSVVVSDDVTASGISLASHTHTGNGAGAETSGPH